MTFLIVDTKNRIVPTSDPFDCSIMISPAIQQKSQVKLLSLTMPFCWYQIRAGFDTFSFSLYDSFDLLIDTYTLVVEHGNYSSTELASNLQTMINNAITETSTVAFDVATGKVHIDLTSGCEMEIHETGLSKHVLGFTDGQISTASSLVADNRYNLSHDTYIVISIENLSSPYNGGVATYVIPVLANANDIINHFSELTFSQTAKLEANNLTAIKLSVKDKYGNVLSNNGIDFSMILELI
jgi:hypothetical protein